MMGDLSENMGIDESFDLLPTDIIFNEQSNSIYNDSINGTSNSVNDGSGISNETMRFLFIVIATVTTLICLAICISVCICICLHRRRHSKHPEKTDHRLIPEPSEIVSSKRISLKYTVAKNSNANGTQPSDKKNLSSSIRKSSSHTITEKKPIRPYYYDNLDDIPFIDESRPTSYIDITRV